MGDLGDGIGTVIEGGLLGRAVEPKAGEAHGHNAAGPVVCANCQTVFSGNFCPACGQKAHIHRSLAAIGHDIMHGVLHLDGKLWNTLPLLVFKPGDLTRRFIAGERAKFVSPMSMFLFTVFAMFAVFQMVGVTAPTDFGDGLANAFNDNGPFQQQIQTQITELEKERGQLAKGDPRNAEIQNEVKTLNDILAKNARKDGAVTNVGFNTGSNWFDEHVAAKWKKNPGLMLYKLQSNGYKFSWLLIPLSVPFLWLMFAWRRQFKAYDHAVFVTYSLSFMSLLFIVMSILGTVPGGAGWAALLFTIGAPLHLYKQLRYAYGLRRFSAFWRFCVLLFCMQVVLTLFLLILGVLGAF
jgi:cell division protein FtsB